ncbi:MAG: ATP-dependent DNA helicase [Candidatus Omnitrophota bacterium]
MKTTILTGLNKEQIEAVTHKEGPLLIIAGAGTGKTAVITRRIAWLLAEKLARPEEILALTFTDKAAQEMEERVDILVPYGLTDIWISTFHAFGDRILRENALDIGLPPDFRVLTRPQASVFLREHLFELPLKHYRPLSDPTRFIDAMINLFSRAKDEDVSSDEYIEYTSKLEREINPDDPEQKEELTRQVELASCYAKFQELLNKYGMVDFGNQFYLALRLFREHPSILARYQRQFKFVLVDEFQDTNYAQFELLKLLAKNNNITVVSDDDQSIYRFRGAAYSNILQFMNNYPSTKKITLIKNYRSTQVILDTAYRLIQHNNPERFEVKAGINKHLVGTSKKGKAVKHLYFDHVSNEADSIAKIIQEKVHPVRGSRLKHAVSNGVKTKKFNYQDFAILVRSNSDAEAFLQALNMYEIPWRFSGNQGLYSRGEIRLCIGFLRLMANVHDSTSLYYLASSDIYKVPLKDLSLCTNYSRRFNQSLFSVLENLDKVENLEKMPKDSKAAIGKLVVDINKFLEISREHTTGRLLYLFLTETGCIKRLIKELSLVNEEKVQNIARFFQIVRDFENIAKEDRVVYFVDYIDMLIEAGDDPATAQADLDAPAVNVMTVHKAKGLEFEVVFIVSLVGGRFPWPHRRQGLELSDALIKDILPSGDFHLQEERRLFYVAMTRAKKELYLTSSRDYGGSQPRRVSQFVMEALGLKKSPDISFRSSAQEYIQKFKPPAKRKSGKVTIEKDEIISLSYYQVDDYLTCPLKYKYVHILRVPIIAHHTVIYGKAIHDAISRYFELRLAGKEIDKDRLFGIFEASFKPEGFLSRQHYEERLAKARQFLDRFLREQEASGKLPLFVEKEFSFLYGKDRIVGRWDAIYAERDFITILDFKSSDVSVQKDADKRTRESIQLDIYALAYKQVFGRLPDEVALYFLESGIIGRAEKKVKNLEKIEEKIKIASQGIRQAEFPARPVYLACNWCAYNQICPYAKHKG